MSAVPKPRALRVPWVGRSTPPAVREGFDAAARLLGLSEPRLDREAVPVTVRLGPPGESTLAVIDRRGEQSRTYRFDAEADDLAERLAAVFGGRGGTRAKILVDPARCFARTIDLPTAALPRMRGLLAQELEAATPFRAEAVYSDWYVEGEDPSARTLRVRHIVLKRARLDPLIAALTGAGLVPGPVAVGLDEARTMPVDLLSGGHRSLSGLAHNPRAGDLILAMGALVLLLAALWGLRQNQDAALADLDRAFAAARRAAGPAAPPPVQAGRAAILAERGPPLASTWDAVAAAMPATASAFVLRLDPEGLHLALGAADEGAALAGLGAVPGFGPPVVRSSAVRPDGVLHMDVLLPRAARRGGS